MRPIWAIEVSHWAALLPILALWLYARRSEPDPAVVLIAAAFAVSWVVDSFGAALADNGIPNLWLTYLLAPVQFGILLRAIRPRQGGTVIALFFMLIVAVSLLRGSYTAPETIVHAVAGAFVSFAVVGHRDLAQYRTAVLLYCGATVPFLLALGRFAAPTDAAEYTAWLASPVADVWLAMWFGYQGFRVLALMLMTTAVWSQPRMRLEVIADAPRVDRADAGTVPGNRGRFHDWRARVPGLERKPEAIRDGSRIRVVR